MKKLSFEQFKLVVTVSLKKEIPAAWFFSHQIPVYTLAALKSGILSGIHSGYKGVLFVVTGVGPDASKEAACWIRNHLKPHYVINLGTCGLTDRRYPLGTWIRPHFATNESGDTIVLDKRFPLPFAEKVIDVSSLLSVITPYIGVPPDSWQKHDAIDQECYAQASVFRKSPIHFHCLKFSSDYSDKYTLLNFNVYLDFFVQQIKKLFFFVENGNESQKVSVVIPVYNRRQTIRRAIDSVLNQTYKPEEIIVVDDGSSDGTKEILRSYHNTIKRIFLPFNSGVSRARNEGINHAQTEWIAFLDSDDYWERNKLKKQMDYLKKYPFYEIVQSEEIWIRNGVRVNACKHHKKPVSWIWEPSLERCLISPSSVLVKKALLQRYGNFSEELPVCEDYNLWLKISRHHPVGLESSFSLVKYGGHKDQLSRSYKAMDKYRVQTLVYLLKRESSLHYKKKMISLLRQKLNILIQGYEKRKNLKDAAECRELLNTFVDV